eukprot:164771-Pelagomonas_calceolata.AAC.1
MYKEMFQSQFQTLPVLLRITSLPERSKLTREYLEMNAQKKSLSTKLASRKKKSMPAKRPRALKKGSLASKLERVSPKGPQA